MPAIVIGEVDPDIGAAERATGIRFRIASCMTRVIEVSSFNGLMAKEVMMEMNGFSLSLSLPDATMEASSMTS